jgi:hypothetical protein
MDTMKRTLRKSNLISALAVLLCLVCPVANAYKYRPVEKEVDGKEYIYHYFEFSSKEIKSLAKSYRKCQGYSNGMIEEIWNLAEGMGSDLGRVVGRIWLGDRLYRMSKHAYKEEWPEMEVLIRSRADKEGKWALEFLDVVASIWKKLTSSS